MSTAGRRLSPGRAHDPPGHGDRPLRRVQGIPCDLAGREPAGARGHCADGCVPRRHRTDQGRLGRGEQLDPEPGAVGVDLLDPGRPRPRPRHPRHRRLVGPAREQGGHATGPSPSLRCGRPSRRSAPCSPTRRVTYDGEFVHLDGVELDYVHQERRPKDVPIYLGATGHADDGARGRDRRRGRPQLPRLAGLQRHGDGPPRARSAQGRALGHRPRPPPARRLLARRGPRRPPSTPPACS